jgi:hypothetical protein
LNTATVTTDDIKIVEFGNDIWSLPNAYEIHKDMLNTYHFKRYSSGNVELVKALNYYDLQIEVSDASSLFAPITNRNIPGVVIVNNERIEYLRKEGNILSQLRRGCYGTAIAELHPARSRVVDSSISETIPYNDQQSKYVFDENTLSNKLLIGPLDFVPVKSNRSNWFRSTISEEYGPCDQIEVFVAGKRLRKDPLEVYNEELGAHSPAADSTLEAEFSVEGETPYVKLTTLPPAGTQITIIRRTGKIWNDRTPDAITASNGVTMHKNTNSLVNFILQKSTSMPE